MNDKKPHQRLTEERERVGLTQAQMATAGGVSRRTQINYENEGGSAPDINYLEKVRHEGIDTNYIVTGQPSTAPGRIVEDAAVYNLSSDDKAIHYMQMVIEVQGELELQLSAAQIKILIGYAHAHAPTKDSLKAFIETAVAYYSEEFKKEEST